MAACVVVQPDGTLAFTGQPVSECTGFVMVSGSEYAVYAVMQEALGIPEPELVAGWFVGAFGAVMVFYIAAYGVGRIVKVFD